MVSHFLWEKMYSDLDHPSRKYHEKSHGKSFLALAQGSFRPNGLYLLDEPEASKHESSVERLKKLNNLYMQALITREEYDQKKKQILDEL